MKRLSQKYPVNIISTIVCHVGSSVVSGSAACCESLCACAGATRALLRALAACASRAPLAVRLAYTLGNMAADHDQARDDVCTPHLITVQDYTNMTCCTCC